MADQVVNAILVGGVEPVDFEAIVQSRREKA
jgi:hypothetical protein